MHLFRHVRSVFSAARVGADVLHIGIILAFSATCRLRTIESETEQIGGCGPEITDDLSGTGMDVVDLARFGTGLAASGYRSLFSIVFKPIGYAPFFLQSAGSCHSGGVAELPAREHCAVGSDSDGRHRSHDEWEDGQWTCRCRHR